jgi:YfiH family protein
MEIFEVEKTKMGSKYLRPKVNMKEVSAFFTMRNTIVDASFLSEIGLANKTCVFLKQVHGDKIYKFIKRNKKEWEKASFLFVSKPYCEIKGVFASAGDGIITDIDELLLTTIHADCLPIYFFDPIKGSVGLAHSGWKGTSLEISKKMVESMCEEGSKVKDLKVIIGPGISKCCFEVRDDVINVFREKYGREFLEKVSVKKDKEKYLLDLKAICIKQLKDAGVLNIETSEFCTVCNLGMFYSYRAEGAIEERMIAGITINKKD